MDGKEFEEYENYPFIVKSYYWVYVLQMFEYRFIKFYYDHLKQKFCPIIFDCNLPCEEIHKKFANGISSNSAYLMQLIKYGKCLIDVPVKSPLNLLVTEILDPFYLF